MWYHLKIRIKGVYRDMSYNAFISYRHIESDLYVAKQVHRRLETFKVPQSVARKIGNKKIQRVFRDQEELPIGSDLSDNITKALRESEYLIVICSPQTPQSYWVQTEIETFIRLHGRDKILAVLVEGEPSESFPKQLLTDETGRAVEPLAADVRGKSRSEITRKIRTEIVRLAATILGCSYDELRQRHKERRMRKIIGASMVIAMLAVAFGIYSVCNYMAIQKNYEGKLINQSKYLADTSLSLLNKGDRITAGLIALEALPSADRDRPVVTAAQYALSQSLYAYENGMNLVKDRLIKHDLQVKTIRYCQNGSKLVTVDQSGNVYVWNTDDGMLNIKITPQIDKYGTIEYVLDAMLTENNTIVIITSCEVKGIDMDGKLLWNASISAEYIGCVIDTEAEIVACISNNVIDFIDVSEGEIIQTVDNLSKSSSFSSDAVFNHEHNMFAVAHYGDEEKECGEISVVNLDTGDCTILKTEYSYIMTLAFTLDNNITVISREYEKLLDYTNERLTAKLEKISVSNETNIWNKDVSIVVMDLWTSSADIKCRKYTSTLTGTTHDEIILTMSRTVYTFNSQTGESVSEINLTSEIASTLIAEDSGSGYIVENTGTINFYNLTTGIKYIGVNVEIDRNVSDVIIKKGVLAAVIYASPDVILMKYHEGYGMECVSEYDSIVYGMDCSEDESFYVIETGGLIEETSYYFYSSTDNKLLAEWSIEEGDYPVESCFISNSVYAVMASSGNIFIYNLDDNTTKCIEKPLDISTVNWILSDNHRFALAYDFDRYYLVDFESGRITADGVVSELINCGVISEDGKKLYANGMENTVFCIDIDSGSITYIDEEYRLSWGDPSRKTMALTSDGRFLAVSCADNILRIWDDRYEKTIAEIPYAGQNSSFLMFMPDDNKLIMQGDTYYLKIYDLDSEEFVFISDEQYNYIDNMVVDREVNMIALCTISEMLILNRKDFEILAYVKNGLSYMPVNGYVFNQSGDAVYRFPYMDLDMLIAEAERQFKGNELTEWERTQYNID